MATLRVSRAQNRCSSSSSQFHRIAQLGAVNWGNVPLQRTRAHPFPRTNAQKLGPSDEPELAGDRRRELENELRDPKNFVEYFLPRPLRLIFFAGSSVSCLIAALLTVVAALKDSENQGVLAQNVLVDVLGLGVFIALFLWDQKGGEQRIEQRRKIRAAQINLGDREVFYNAQGERMSRLKEVDDEWILRRLERWGKRDNMPFIGPKKAAALRALVQQKKPRLAVEVGTMAGYSAIVLAQALPPGGRLLSFEKELLWVLTAKRFLWQAGQGQKRAGEEGETVGDKVDVRWGDATSALPTTLAGRGPVDFLFLDGIPRDSLAYLRAAEPLLAPGATVVADNAGVFAAGGMKGYLDYVRGSGRYRSRQVEVPLEWRDDVPDAMEVSEYLGEGGEGPNPA